MAIPRPNRWNRAFGSFPLALFANGDEPFSSDEIPTARTPRNRTKQANRLAATCRRVIGRIAGTIPARLDVLQAVIPAKHLQGLIFIMESSRVAARTPSRSLKAVRCVPQRRQARRFSQARYTSQLAKRCKRQSAFACYRPRE